MKQMHAHAQYCWSGDHTLEGTDLAIKRITAEEADDYFVVVLSDANLERYGIPAEAFGKALTSDPRVNAFAIFIGSLGNQADRYGVVKPDMCGRNQIMETETKCYEIRLEATKTNSSMKNWLSVSSYFINFLLQINSTRI